MRALAFLGTLSAVGLALFACPELVSPALADQSSFPMDYDSCLDAISQAATQLHIPLNLSVNNVNQKALAITTAQGTVTMLCDRTASTLTVVTPAGQSILPYISGGR